MNTRCGKRTPAGFTLVELLVVMAIIGVLVAILLPTIYFARVRAIETRIAMEIGQLDAAVENYKQQYGDYPPDFSDVSVVERHLSTCFPRINPRELAMMVNWTPQIDPAEALVLMLGGLSDNPQRPFSGNGGPIVVDDSGTEWVPISYNPDRNVGFFEFDLGRLTLRDTDDGRWISTDEETLLNGAMVIDVFPVYAPRGYQVPYVYFDSRTYLAAVYPPPQVESSPNFGWAMPYRDELPENASPENKYFQNRRSFQILSAGMDDIYGTERRWDKVFPTGQHFDMELRADHDNIANFSQGPFRDSLP